MRDELLDGELFYSLREAQIIIGSWRIHYNTRRPHASLGYRPPAPEVFVPAMAAWPRRRMPLIIVTVAPTAEAGAGSIRPGSIVSAPARPAPP